MNIREITEKSLWEDFVLQFKPNNFLASWNWGQFNAALGQKVFKLGLFQEEVLIGVCLIIKVTARRGTFLICPAGPMLINPNEKDFAFFITELKKLATSEKASFVRVRPLEEVGKIEQWMKDLKMRPSPTHVHAQVSWLIEISKSEEELLADMRKTTRYLIRQADKEEIVITEESNSQGLKLLEKLQLETAKRHKFVPFSDKYLEKEFETFFEDNQVKIFVARKGEQVLAAAMVLYYGDCAFYHHGASVETKLPVTYKLQWEAIKKAKEEGKNFYNFWGIAPNDSPKHPWAGLTLFKQGFGGFRTEYTVPHDLPLSSTYPITFWFEKLRQNFRGLE